MSASLSQTLIFQVGRPVKYMFDFDTLVKNMSQFENGRALDVLSWESVCSTLGQVCEYDITKS